MDKNLDQKFRLTRDIQYFYYNQFLRRPQGNVNIQKGNRIQWGIHILVHKEELLLVKSDSNDRLLLTQQLSQNLTQNAHYLILIQVLFILQYERSSLIMILRRKVWKILIRLFKLILLMKKLFQQRLTLLQYIGNNQNAIKDFDQIIKINPKNAFFSLGTMLNKQGLKDASIKYFSRAVEICENPLFQVNLGNTYYQETQYQLAQSQMKEENKNPKIIGIFLLAIQFNKQLTFFNIF